MSLTIPGTIRLLLPDGTMRRLRLEDYVRGVVAATLEPDAPLEALKAQAVAARTFAANTHRHIDRGADVCTLRHCQAWSERSNPNAARAVIETENLVAVHDGKLIQAFYFEHCDGKTRDAAGILVDPPPYLRSVKCPCGFATIKGHGIGMCQRGMLVMARFGESFDTILKNYYSGITLERAASQPLTPAEAAALAAASARTARTARPGTRERPPSKLTDTLPTESSPPAAPPARRKPAARPRPTPPTQPEAKPETPPAPSAISAQPSAPRAPRRTSRRKLEQEMTTAQPEATKQAPGEEPRAVADEGRDASATRLPAMPTTPQEVPPQAAAPRDAAPQHLHETQSLAPPPTLPTDSGEELHLVTLDQPLAAQADDLLYFLAVEDLPPPASPSPPPAQTPAPVPAPFVEPAHVEPPVLPPIFGTPFLTPNEPPPSMPEELPSALELEMMAPPQTSAAPDSDLFNEPELDATLPLFERFYNPPDAPPTMPEALPTFGPAPASADPPIVWAPPPPLHEAATSAQPGILVDYLPGPRIIAGNLPRVGTIVTIRDAWGNSTVTVSGGAKHYGEGGFEAPLTDNGVYHVHFDGMQVEVKLENETVFVYREN